MAFPALASPSLSPRTSDVPNPPQSTVALPPQPTRSRSVQFSQSSMSRPRDQDGAYHDRAESSADEITPIAGRERGAMKSYEATAKASGNEARNWSKDSRPATRRQGSRGLSRQSRSSQGEPGGWWRDFVDKYGSVELDNKGSVARDHLALERTFLAWLRTSLAFASIGIAITQLFRLNTTIQEGHGFRPSDPANSGSIRLHQLGKPLGATFLGIAMLVLIVGGRRYFESQYWIIRGKFPVSRGSIFLVTFISAALIVTSLVLVVVISPSAFKR